MMRLCRALVRFAGVPLAGDDRGLAAIETAIVAPVLLLLSAGAIDASRAVAQQNELQTAADIAAGVTLATRPSTSDNLTTLKNVIAVETGLALSSVQAAFIYRCGTAGEYVGDMEVCGSDTYTTYVRIVLRKTYDPMWSKFGFGGPIKLQVTRQAIAEQSK